MKIVILSILLPLLFSSCTIKFDPFVKPEKKVEATSNKDLWLGKHVETLDLHPKYASMEMNTKISSTGIEVRSYKNSGGRASSNCFGFIGCNQKQVEIICNHIFYIKAHNIIDHIRSGECTEEEDPTLAPIIQKNHKNSI